jgi:uncharacterized protein
MESSSKCIDNNRKLVTYAANCILGVGSTLSLLFIVYFLSTIINGSNVYAQLSHSSLTQNINSSLSNNITLSVAGSATTNVKPDRIILTLGVQTTNQTAEAALN